jgi:hypothetical protein
MIKEKQNLFEELQNFDWKNQPLQEFRVYEGISVDQMKGLEKTIKTAEDEATLQKFLEKNPEILINHLGGGQGRWVIAQKRLGSEFVPDFVIGEKSSLGFEWYLVELESPKAKMFTKAGNQSFKLTHAINQIQKWRSWLSKNKDYASRLRSDDGLGLTDISHSPPGLILIGRREQLDDSKNKLRKQISDDIRIAIHTYDFLIDRHGPGQDR